MSKAPVIGFSNPPSPYLHCVPRSLPGRGFRGRFNRLPLLLIMLSVVIQGCPAQSRANGDRNAFIVRMSALCDHLAQDAPLLRQTIAIAGGEVIEQRPGRYVVLKGNDMRTVISCPRREGKATVRQVQLYPETEMGLTIKDLAKGFGKWRLVHKSKDSSVRFSYKSEKNGGKVTIFATMAFAPENPDSPIRTITLRPGDADQ